MKLYHKKWLIAFILLFAFFGVGFCLKQSVTKNTEQTLLTVHVVNGAVDILTSQNGKLYYMCNERVFRVSQSTMEKKSSTITIKTDKKNNWKPDEIMKLYVPENVYSKLVLDSTGILSIKELHMDYLINNSGGLQMLLPNNYTGNIYYTGDSDSFLELVSEKNTTNYTCEVRSSEGAFTSLPFPDFDSFRIPKKYKYRAGEGEHSWTFRVGKNATFAMEFK